VASLKLPVASLTENSSKIGAKFVSHGRYAAVRMAKAATGQNLFADIWRLIAEPCPRPHPLVVERNPKEPGIRDEEKQPNQAHSRLLD
jgi:hypothetical protein